MGGTGGTDIPGVPQKGFPNTITGDEGRAHAHVGGDTDGRPPGGRPHTRRGRPGGSVFCRFPVGGRRGGEKTGKTAPAPGAGKEGWGDDPGGITDQPAGRPFGTPPPSAGDSRTGGVRKRPKPGAFLGWAPQRGGEPPSGVFSPTPPTGGGVFYSERPQGFREGGTDRGFWSLSPPPGRFWPLLVRP